MIDALLHSLATSNLPLTDEELADVLWLASYMDMPSNAPALANALDAKPASAVQTNAQNRHQHAAKDQQTISASGQSTASAQAEVHLPKPSTHDKQRVDGMRAVSFRSPAATALPGKLALARALRPILRKIPSSTQQELDEVATAEQAAEEGRIAPQLRPGRERWLDVAVVIDDWHTMAIWQQTITEFIELLQQLGAFRTLQTYLLSTKDDEQTEQATLQLFTVQGFKRGRICPPGELVDPRGRRLTLVLTDCTSPAWSSGAAGQLLSQWGNRNMVTLVQMLPADLWNSCALTDAIQIAVSAPAPGIHNAKLAVENPWYWDDIWDEDRTPAMLSQPVPIITLEPEPLRRWTQVMAGKGGSKATAFYLSLQSVPSSNRDRQVTSEALSPEERWRRFRAAASPLAQELAGYLSAAPLSLPVMRLVQRTLLPQSRQVHLAEILRSGLIYSIQPDDNKFVPDAIRYDFVTGVRSLLLRTVLYGDTIAVLEKVSEYMSRRTHQLRNFHAAILDPFLLADFTLDENSIPFGKIAAEVLYRLGGKYTLLAERLKVAIGQTSAFIDSQVTSISAPSLFEKLIAQMPELLSGLTTQDIEQIERIFLRNLESGRAQRIWSRWQIPSNASSQQALLVLANTTIDEPLYRQLIYLQQVVQTYRQEQVRLQALSQHDNEAWRKLSVQLTDSAHHLLIRKGVDSPWAADLALDMAQETCRKIYSMTFPCDIAFDTWTRVILNNQILHQLMRSKELLDRQRHIEPFQAIQIKQEVRNTFTPVEEFFDNLGDTLFFSSEQVETRDWLISAIAQLPSAERRAVIVYTYFYELSDDEIAQKLGKSKGGVHTLRHRALKQLQQILDRG